MGAAICWCWDRAVYKDLLRVAGGKERIRAFDRLRGGALSDAEIAELHRIKTTIYADLIATGACSCLRAVARSDPQLIQLEFSRPALIGLPRS
jgi:hypothetical protein